MGRAPYDVLVVVYSLDAFPHPAYAVFREIGETGDWQVLSGHGARGEQPPQAARRHACAAGAPPDARLIALDTRATACIVHRGRAVEIAQHAFAVGLEPGRLLVPADHEHSWVTYDVACGLVRQRAALDAMWELRRRLGCRAAGTRAG